MRHKRRTSVLLLLIAVMGCSGPRAYLNPEADLGFYRRVGVASFVSLADDPRAGQKLQRVFVTELLKREGFQIVSPGQFEKTESDIRSKQGLALPAPLDSASIKALGDQTGVQGVIVGTVRDYRMERVGQEEFPLVTFSLQLIDVPTSRVVWDVSIGERGGPKFPVFSFGETHTLSELSAKLCRKALRTL